MKLSLVQQFNTKFVVKLPGEPTGSDKKTDNYREITLEGTYKLFPQTEDAVVSLKQLQDERGIYGFLQNVMLDCKAVTPTDLEFEDENGAAINCLEFAQKHIIAQQAAMLAFWDVVNKGVEEKNSRKSQKR